MPRPCLGYACIWMMHRMQEWLFSPIRACDDGDQFEEVANYVRTNDNHWVWEGLCLLIEMNVSYGKKVN